MDKTIGRLNERTLHLTLKNMLEPDPAFHEVKYLGYVADIKRGNEIIEIETRSFANLRKKLDAFLEDCTVTLVYPVSCPKYVVWVDPVTGELSEKRRSPKKGRPSDISFELYRLRGYLGRPGFGLKIITLEMTDYRRRDGWSRDGKRGAVRIERIPGAVSSVLDISSPQDYRMLADVIPDGEFTAAEFAAANRMKPRYAWYLLSILCSVAVISKCGKRGRADLYTAVPDGSEPALQHSDG